MPQSHATHQAADPTSSASRLPTDPADSFPRRHLGSSAESVSRMLHIVGHASLNNLIDAAVPDSIRLEAPLNLPGPIGENEVLRELRKIGSMNKVRRSLIGMGYSDCVTPPVIQRNILENPGWYTQYTPYQAEISQGRLEALLNFQTMISDLTGLEVSNASLLDEGTAAAEAMGLAYSARGGPKRNAFFVADDCHPQTIGIIQTRAAAIGIEVVVGPSTGFAPSNKEFGVLLQYPATDGSIHDYGSLISQVHEAGGLAIVACDLLALSLLRPPGDFGADVAVGSAQRFGVPLGFGGPHAGFFATRDKFKRQTPGRLVGVSKDARGQPALRLSLQTREQHIRRDKATSNICTAQVLLAVMAAMYGTYHGPDGLRAIAKRIRLLTRLLATTLNGLGFTTNNASVFDTLKVCCAAGTAGAIHDLSREAGFNFRELGDSAVGISLDETSTIEEIAAIAAVFAKSAGKPAASAPTAAELKQIVNSLQEDYPAGFARTSDFLTHPVFHKYRTETEFLRYVRRLESRDLSLCHSMIPLGSCTMKLNAAVEMLPITWPEWAAIHPFAPADQTAGYRRIFSDLEKWLAEITGFSAVSLQPNAGSQGEYAGLLAIRAWHESRGDRGRSVCLIPVSAHGTNPASAVMVGMRVVPVACDAMGNIDMDDLREKAETHASELAALMVTYPSTHGVFEDTIRDVCKIIHDHGGQVYMDGANMNAQVGLTSPGAIGADVCHLNLHKTFCIPHGGGGPGVGPIAVAAHLAPFLPGHPVVDPHDGKATTVGPVSAAPWGSALILLISWSYIRMMGSAGLTEATRMAILNANYMAERLAPHFPILYRGRNKLVAHEFIVDLREWKQRADVEVEDVAKRLMDYGFHAPTMSWPVPGTIMIEPTESESQEELDRLCDALIAIGNEMKAIQNGQLDRANNPLKRAPHTASDVVADNWDRPYPRETAAFPTPWTRAHKFWPAVARIDNVYGDRNLVCSCAGMDAFTTSAPA